MTLRGRVSAPGPAALALWCVCLLFILIPLASFLAYGFLPVVDNNIVYRPTFDNFVDLLSNSSYRTTFPAHDADGARSLRAQFRARLRHRLLHLAPAVGWRNLLVVALAIPLLMSYIIKIYAMRGVLGTNGLLNSALIALGLVDEPVSALLFNLTAVRITLSVVLLPFMVLPIYIALERIPASLLHAAADLGASEFQIFRWVILPSCLPARSLVRCSLSCSPPVTSSRRTGRRH